MAEKAVRDGQFYEIYHPHTGEIYGGIQEVGSSNIVMHHSCRHQTWSATGYLSLIYYELLGAKIGYDSVSFAPYLPEGVNEVTIKDFKVGKATFDVSIKRGGNNPSKAEFNTTEEGTYTVLLSV